MGPSIVELVEDIGRDPARTPLAVIDLGAALALHGHVVRVDLGGNAVEEDAPLASHVARPAREEPGRQLLHDRPAVLVACLRALRRVPVCELIRALQVGLGLLQLLVDLLAACSRVGGREGMVVGYLSI